MFTSAVVLLETMKNKFMRAFINETLASTCRGSELCCEKLVNKTWVFSIRIAILDILPSLGLLIIWIIKITNNKI